MSKCISGPVLWERLFIGNWWDISGNHLNVVNVTKHLDRKVVWLPILECTVGRNNSSVISAIKNVTHKGNFDCSYYNTPWWEIISIGWVVQWVKHTCTQTRTHTHTYMHTYTHSWAGVTKKHKKILFHEVFQGPENNFFLVHELRLSCLVSWSW